MNPPSSWPQQQYYQTAYSVMITTVYSYDLRVIIPANPSHVAQNPHGQRAAISVCILWGICIDKIHYLDDGLWKLCELNWVPFECRELTEPTEQREKPWFSIVQMNINWNESRTSIYISYTYHIYIYIYIYIRYDIIIYSSNETQKLCSKQDRSICCWRRNHSNVA